MESFRQIKNNNVDLISNNDPLDKNRLLIEDLWESVLREECPDEQAERLIQLKELSYSKQIDGDSSKTFKNEIVDIVNSMDLAESIAAARAFSLYFQLVNILEQRVEEDRYIFKALPIRMFKNRPIILILLLQHWLGKMLQ